MIAHNSLNQSKADYTLAFIDAHNTYRTALSSYAYFKTHNHSLSEDLVQDTFVRTWKYLVKNGKIESMKAFLYHILRHLIVDEYRKRKTMSLDILLEKGFDPGMTDHERMFDSWDGKKAAEFIAQLPEKYQEVVQMRYIQGLSIKEIAVLTNRSRNTVAVQSHRGLEKLKALYRAAQHKCI